MEKRSGRSRVKRLIPRDVAKLAAAVEALKPERAQKARDLVDKLAALEGHPDSNALVREAIREADISMTELAEESGVDLSILSRFLSERTRARAGAEPAGLTLKTFDKLAPVLGLQITKKARKRTGRSRGKADAR